MVVQIHTGMDPEGNDLAVCEVVTEDATGQERWYEISLTDDNTFDDGYLLAGKQTDPNQRPIVSDLALEAARDHFRSLGFEVHEP